MGHRELWRGHTAEITKKKRYFTYTPHANIHRRYRLTLRAQLIKSSSLVMTYSPLLLATGAGLAATTAVLFSLTGTTLHQEGCCVDCVFEWSVLMLKTHLVTAFSPFALWWRLFFWAASTEMGLLERGGYKAGLYRCRGGCMTAGVNLSHCEQSSSKSYEWSKMKMLIVGQTHE